MAQSGSVIRPGSLVFVCQSATRPTSSCFQSLAGGSDLVPPVPNSSSPLPASPQPSHGQGSLPLESQSPRTDRHLVSSLPRPPPDYLSDGSRPNGKQQKVLQVDTQGLPPFPAPTAYLSLGPPWPAYPEKRIFWNVNQTQEAGVQRFPEVWLWFF